MLKKVASVVKPIMRNRNWRVGTLTEFFPTEQNLLGLNINRGQRICLRLRYAGDRTQFLPLENVIDTMLHELSHNLIGPHNSEFHQLWNALRDEYDDLKIRGFTGEGFLSQGHRLGGRNVPIHEARRRARVVAEQKARLQKHDGQKLGGRPLVPGQDVRQVIADAVQSRVTITNGCASNTQRAEGLANEASFNGFRTQAEEDDANQRAIEQALWELYQEEEMRKAGVTPDSQLFASDGEGLQWDPSHGLALNTAVQRTKSAMSPALPESPTVGLGPLPHPPTALPSTPPVPSKSSLRKPAALNTGKGKAVNTAVPPLLDKPCPVTKHPAPSLPGGSVGSNDRQLAQEHSQPALLKPDVFDSNRRSPPSASSGDGAGGLQTLAATTYTPPLKRKQSESPLLVDISSFDDDYNQKRAGPATLRVASSSLTTKTWMCPECTFSNRIDFLQCEMCSTQQPGPASVPSALAGDTSMAEQLAEYQAIAVAREMAAKRESQMRQRERDADRQRRMQEMERERLAAQHAERERLYHRAPPRPQTGPIGWSCTGCGSFMEASWWTCSACGKMKESS